MIEPKMSVPTTLGAGLMAAALSAQVCAAQTIDLRCADLPPEDCGALAEALAARWPGISAGRPGAPLTVTFVLTARTADRIQGHLEWWTAGGEHQSGPTAETALFDGAPQSGAVAELARALARLTDLPI